MPTTPLAGLPYPSGSAAPAGAADLMALALSLDAGALLVAADEAERDSRYGDAPRGALVVGGTDGGPLWLWVKTAAAAPTWSTLYHDTGWLPLTNFADGHAQISAQARGLNGVGYLRGNVSNADVARTGIKSLASLPAAVAPASTFESLAVMSFDGLVAVNVAAGGLINVNYSNAVGGAGNGTLYLSGIHPFPLD